MKYIAHTKDGKNYVNDEESQSLKEHLENVSKYAGENAGKLGASSAGEHIGRFHDLGKYSDLFQAKIRGKKIKAPHAIYGAVLFDMEKDPITKLYGMLIAGHHSGLSNTGNRISAGDGSYYAMLNECDKQIPVTDEISKSINITHKRLRIGNKKSYSAFAIATHLRMLFSCLVDADYTDTEEYATGIKRSPISQSFELLVKECFNNIPKNDGKPINQIRKEILENCIKCAECPQGLFSLTVPTGGGKTISSLAFALLHAKKYNLDRVIYVIPYTSIIDQNAKIIADMLGDEYVLKHHSNMVFEKEDFRKKWASENWDIPVVITTNVQFFESFFSNKPSKSRKIHNIANSVIIFDEAQMLPREYLSPSLYAISELVENYNVTAVLCSATQPAIKKYKYRHLECREMIDNPERLAQILKRVEYTFIGKKTDDELVDMVIDSKKALVVVNSRRHAFKLFSLIKKYKQQNVYYLSTLLPPIIRLKKIEEIKAGLEKGEDIIVISTQLIEAGVDLDFPYVFRSIAGIDSIIQAGGRANREGNIEMGKVFVFEPSSQEGKIPKSLQLTAGIGKGIIDELGQRAFELDGITKYFEVMYDFNERDGILDSKEILSEFVIYRESIELNFQKVADMYKIIEDNTYDVIIPHKEIECSIKDLRNNTFDKNTLRRLGEYQVSLYNNEFIKLLNEKAIENVNGFYVLSNMHYYDEERGVDIFTEENKNGYCETV